MLFHAGLNMEEARAVDFTPLANKACEETPQVLVPGRKSHDRDIVYFFTELLGWLSVWFDLGGLTVERRKGQGGLAPVTDAVAMCA